jgi:uncharacterized protein (TIGR02145 family)
MKKPFLKAILISCFCILTSDFILFAQAPQRLSYQAEIRNAGNALVVNTLVGMRFSILQGSATGTVVYSERHTPTTNANGLVSLQIGGGTVISGTFASIAWGSGTYFLKTETDPAGGTNYTISGTQQMLSVPYALFSNTSNNGVPSGGGQGQVLTNCEGIAIWTIGGICPGVITAINCATATNNGTLTKGVAAASVSSSVPYTGGNGGPHNGQTVTSTGVTGLTATLAAGNFATGAGSLTYTITGTPATSGTASFALNIGGKTCTLTRTVALPVGTITALSCSTATNAGTLGQGVAAASVSSTVPYTGGNGGTHTGQTVTSTGVTGLTATRAAGNFATGSGTLVYTITGTPASSGTASFALNMGGQTCTLTRTVLASASITALNCSTATNNGTLGQGTAAASVSSSVPYTGGNGGYRGAQTFTSTGVTGLTATCAAGTLATGAGNLTFTITGTPASAGTASFALSIGGQTCTLNRTVLPSASITALSCSTATNNGTLTQGIAAASVSSSVPYTGGNGGYRGAQTVTSTGVTGLTATCAAGTLATGAGSLTYTITGTPASIGTASFALSVGGQTCTLTRTVLPVGTITALNCSTATTIGFLTQGIAASGAGSLVDYTGGNGGNYPAQTITSTGVTGLTATSAAGTLLSGAGNVFYTITGTPASSGTASFALSLGGQTCTLERFVFLPAGTITALSCSTATNTGTLTQGIAAASVSSSVPYTGGNGGLHPGQTVTSTGVTGLTATLALGTFLSGAGSVTYTITGTPATVGTASFALNIGGQTCTLTRTVVEGLASLSTRFISDITSTTATSGGNITADGGAAITARGVCWSTSANPTIALTTKTSNGSGTGTFTSSLTGLTANTLYYVRAYATNSAGTAYGSQVSFTTTNPTDADGNIYTTVTIGTQVWMKENLKVSKYRNGDAIPTNLTDAAWGATTSGAYAIYNNDAAYNTTYGKLYNFYAVADSRNLCPVGWHVPSDAEWTTLENFLGGQTIAGGKMKSTGTKQAGTGLWQAPNTEATNSSGFSGLPGGYRYYNGSYYTIGFGGYWWSSTEYSTALAWGRLLGSESGYSDRFNYNRHDGRSVRCLRD